MRISAGLSTARGSASAKRQQAAGVERPLRQRLVQRVYLTLLLASRAPVLVPVEEKDTETECICASWRRLSGG